jgi:GNAT superfamily N-acetyltransferase
MNNVNVRQYMASDKTQCRDLWRELTGWHRYIYNDPINGGPSPEDYFDKHLANVGADNLWVATYKYLVIGLVGIIIKDNEAYVEPLIVNQRYRHRGVGTQLLKSVIAEVQRLAIRFLNFNPVARNINAMQFFHSQARAYKHWTHPTIHGYDTSTPENRCNTLQLSVQLLTRTD